MSPFLLSGCLVPTTNDFKGDTPPLSASEVLVTWRVPLTPRLYDVLDTSKAYAAELMASMQPIREQIVPRIYDDLIKGRLILYSVDEIQHTDSAKPRDLFAYLRTRPGWLGDNNREFANAFHISQRRQASQQGFDAKELALTLIYRDPNEEFPEAHFGEVMFSALDSLGYSLTINGKKMGFMEYLEENPKIVYPIGFYTLERQGWSLGTIKSAMAAKAYLLEGKWDELEWLGFEPNLMKLTVVNRKPEELRELVGEYYFEPGQDTSFTTGGDSIFVTIDISEDYLVTQWSNKHEYFYYVIYPTENDQFFSSPGDLISFEKRENNQMQMTIKTTEGAIIKGYSR